MTIRTWPGTRVEGVGLATGMERGALFPGREHNIYEGPEVEDLGPLEGLKEVCMAGGQ